MEDSLLEVLCAEKLLLCEWCPNSVLGPQSRPDPSSPAERGELGEEQQLQFQLLLRRRIHWLVKIALLLASVPGLASGFPERAGIERLQPPPSLQTGSAGGHMAAAAAPAAALPCPGRPLGRAFVPEAPCKPGPGLESRAAPPSLIREGNQKSSPAARGLVGSLLGRGGKVNARLSVQIVFCSPLAQVCLSRCLETALRSRLVQCRDFFF